ncbi:MAG: hypothetical protein HY585_05315 [Candidatus Omnitrophica bacterium]|nr:hypothetical protein [Candidatus Omnitrophota bacterium]
MEPSESPAKPSVRIERPTPEKISSFFVFLLLVSFFLIAFTVWLLVLEWTGEPLPPFLKLPL